MTDSVVPRFELNQEARLKLPVREWKRLNELLAQALDLGAAQRVSWLATLPEEDRHLVPVLQRLLDPARSDVPVTMSDRLPRLAPLARSPGERVAATGVEAEGSTVGPYRLLRELAVGGMGTVWLAERTDGTFERKVALKLPRAEWTDRGLAERMARERAVLASLNHPNIAQMYEAGWAADGRPYLALEHVDGEPIDAWCAGRALAPSARVQLFVEVVRAVAYAHAKLVIHRDLKPSNVLVTRDGRVKLLDFGIAKLLSADATLAEETALTRLSGRALTLRYAAPEQVLGQPVSTAADTYSLGVMLFELLTATRPYRPARDSRGALEEAIVTADPLRPSSAASDPAASRALRGDLDAILLKALRKQPEDRYETAAAFADDLERWLDQRPVRAQRSSGWYRLRRFLGRHRMRVSAAAAAAGILLAAGAVLLWQRQVSAEDAARAATVKAFVLSVIEQADPSATGATREADLTLLTTTERRLEKELENHPDLALELRIAIARAYRNRGDFQRAGETLKQAIADAERVLPRSDPRLARAWIEAAEWHIAFPVGDVGAELDRAIETMRRLGKEGAELAIEGLQHRAHLQRLRHRRPAQLEDLRQAHELAIRYFGEDHPKTLLAAVRHHALFDDVAESLALTEQAYRTALAHAGLSRSDPVFLEIQWEHGLNLCAAGRGREGLPLLRTTVDAARRQHGGGIVTERALGSLYRGLGLAGDKAGALAIARDMYALAASRESPGSPHRAIMANTVLFASLQSRRLEGVDAMVKEAAALKGTAAWHQAMLVWLRNLQGDAAGAAELAPRAIEAHSRAFRQWLPIARLGWSYALRQLGNAEESRRVLQALEQQSDAMQLPDFGDVLKERAAVELAVGDAAQAVATAEKAIEPLSKVRMQTDPHLSDLQLTRGQALLQLGRNDEALAAFRVSDDFWSAYDARSHWAAESRYWLARALIATGDRAGRPLLDAARARLEQSPMPLHRRLASASIPE